MDQIFLHQSPLLSLNCFSYNLSLFFENFLPLLALIEIQLSPENVLSPVAFLGDGFLFLPAPPITESGGGLGVRLVFYCHFQTILLPSSKTPSF